MNERITLLSAALLGCMAVILGASGAHSLKPLLIQLGKVETYELATRYHFYHTLALLAIGILQHLNPAKKLRYASVFILAGTLLFSGSLYLMCFVKLSLLGPLTPLGGLFLIVGWIFSFLGVYKKVKAPI